MFCKILEIPVALKMFKSLLAEKNLASPQTTEATNLHANLKPNKYY